MIYVDKFHQKDSHALESVFAIMQSKGSLPRQCYAHNLRESFELHLNLQHIFDELFQKQQLEVPEPESSPGKVLLYLQQKDHQDQVPQ